MESNNYSTTYLGQWPDTLKDIDSFCKLVGDKLFDCDFDPIFTELSRRSCRRYIDWLYEARDKICSGENPYKVLAYYDVVLRDLITEDKKYGKSYGRSRKDARS